MAVFSGNEVNWSRIDYATIVGGGIVSLDLHQADECRAWLERHHYRIVAIDCGQGLASLCKRVNEVFDWQGQFGYDFQGHSLDALRDGFHFDVPGDGGTVLELRRPDLLWETERNFMAGLLAIASGHTHVQMAEGNRFFTVLIIDGDARMIGAPIEARQVPAPWWRPHKPFDD